MAVFGALMALVAFAGCGDDEDSSASSSDSGPITVEEGSLSKAEFVKQADAICKQGKAKLDGEYAAFFKTNEPETTPKGERRWLEEVIDEVVVPGYQEQIDEIAALGPPSEDVDQVTSFLRTLEARLEFLEEKPLELTQNLTPFKQAGQQAAKAGLQVCAELLGA